MSRMTWMIWMIGLVASIATAAYYRHQAFGVRQQMAAVEKQSHAARGFNPAALNPPSSPPAPTLKQSGGPIAGNQILARQEVRIRELEAELQNKEALIRSLQQPAATNASRRRLSGLEELKKSDPQRYAAFTNQREQARQAYQMSMAEKAVYFSERDPSLMSEEDQANYQQLSQLLNETAQLTALLQNSQLSSADRSAIMQTLRQNRHQIQPLLQAARSTEFVNLGIQLGMNSDNAQAFGAYINQVIDLTSFQSIFRAMRSGPAN